MLKWIKSLFSIVLSIGGWIGLVYAPADIMGLPETYPHLKWLTEYSRETYLVWFSGVLVCYLVYFESRPYFTSIVESRRWIDSEEAAKLIFKYLRRHKIVRDLLKAKQDKGHPLPFSGAMANYFEQGLNEGIIKARGHEEHFDDYLEVPNNVAIKEGMMFGDPANLKEELTAVQDGTDIALIGLLFNKRSIEKYVKVLKSDTSHTDQT